MSRVDNNAILVLVKGNNQQHDKCILFYTHGAARG